MEGQRPLCLVCADLDHLVYLPSGDTALTRRARKQSTLSAVVVRFSRARKRYERQGVLVEETALERAEQEYLADADQRSAQREAGRDLSRETGSSSRVAPGGIHSADVSGMPSRGGQGHRQPYISPWAADSRWDFFNRHACSRQSFSTLNKSSKQTSLFVRLQFWQTHYVSKTKVEKVVGTPCGGERN